MSWAREVAHVAWKDVVYARWVLALHALVTSAVAIMVVAEWSAGPTSVWRTTVIITGMLLVATLVQADSPSRPDADWAHRPLRPSAVFAAKAATILVVAPVAPLLGQLAAVLAHGATPTSIPTLLGVSLVHYGLWLAIAGVVAAITPDLRTFIVGAVAVVAIRSLAGTIAMYLSGPEMRLAPSSDTLRLLLLAVLMAVLAYQYTATRRRRGLAMGVVALLATIVLPATLRSSPRPDATASAATLPADVTRPSLTLREVRPQAGEIRLQVYGSPGGEVLRWRLVDPVLVLHRADGDSTRIPVPRPWRSSINLHGAEVPPAAVIGDSVRWLDGADRSGRYVGTGFSVPVTDSQARQVARGEATVSLQGRIEALQPRRAATLRPAEGATAMLDGHRLRITDMLHTAYGPAFRIVATRLTRSSR